MTSTDISSADLYGTVFVRRPRTGPFVADYYANLEAILPLLCSDDWDQATTGFYINCVKAEGVAPALRPRRAHLVLLPRSGCPETRIWRLLAVPSP